MFKLRLKDLREKKGISQQQLANFLNISQGSVGNWESGIREPNFETITRIADYFDVDTDYLLGRTDSHRQNVAQQLNGRDFALYSEIKELTEEEKEDIFDYIQYVKSRKEKRNADVFLAAFDGAVHRPKEEKTPDAVRKIFDEERNKED